MDITSALQSAVTHQLPEYMKFIFENCQPEMINDITNEDIDLNKLLVSAAQGGNLKIIGQLLDAGADVNLENSDTKTPLGESKDGDVAKFLINKGADVNRLLQNGDNLLIHIVKDRNMNDSANLEVVKVLLENGASVNERGRNGTMPLIAAVLRNENVGVIQMLLDHGADMTAQDDEGNTALMSAVCLDCPINVSFLLDFYRDNKLCLNVQNHRGQTALMYAVVCNKPALVKKLIIGQLLDAGADVNLENSDTKTPLGESKDGDVAKFLINKGADVNRLLQNGDNLLIHIVKDRNMNDSANLEVVKVLLENGASVNERGRNGTIPLIAAVLRKENVGVIQMLLDHGADMTAKDDEGNTALMSAVCLDCPINVSFLLDFYRDNKLCLNVQSHRGQTALMYAVVCNKPALVKKLINLDADLKVKDIKGNTAMLHAATNSVLLRTEILTTLIEAGSDVNCQNNKGLSPLMLAAQTCTLQSILILLDSGADVNAVSKMDYTKTALSFLPAYLFPLKKFKLCLQTFLKKGASLSYISPCFLHNLILKYTIGSVAELIQNSIGPVDVLSRYVNFGFFDNKAIPTVSPLCVALLVGDVSLARYFVGNMFLTSSDVTSLTGDKIIRGALVKRRLQNCLTLLDELSSQSWSLFQLAFVSVSSAVGSSPGRENRVNLLPLPQVMKDKLLFKSHKLPLNAATQDRDYFEEVRDVIKPDFYDSDSTDSDDYNGSDGGIEGNDYLLPFGSDGGIEGDNYLLPFSSDSE